jgi:LPXTG-site transpeptidase (sortase) family protein
MSRFPYTTKPQKPPMPVFVSAAVVIFFLSLSAADSIGFVPSYIDGTAPASAKNELPLSNLPMLGESSGVASTDSRISIQPERILIPSIDLNLDVQNPATRDLEALDELLRSGPARYVDSAKLGETGNMIIFAHSSRLPIVHNKMYQAFNRIPELAQGDIITLQAGGKNYVYSVTGITTADASSTKIDMSASLGTRLTLVTCDTLTGKSARYVLDATFVGSYDI